MTEKKRHFLGLSHNPFSQPSSDFYPLGNRQSVLDQLRHLSRWTRRLLVVSAHIGGGKTTLYRNLSANLDANAKAARINGTLVSGARDVMVGIAQGFGIAIPTEATSQLLNDLIDSHVIELSAQNRISVVLIDDAHLLDMRAVDQLLNVVVKNDLRIVFFAEPAFVNALSAAIERVDEQIEWQEIELSPYTLEEVRSYMERKFKEAAYRGHLPFTEEQVTNIAGLTKGNPGKINEAANDQLLLMESGELVKNRQSFPPLHRAIAMLLVVFLGVVYFSWNPADDPPAMTTSVIAANPIDVDSNDLDLEEPIEIGLEEVAEANLEDEVEEPEPVAEPVIVPEPVADTTTNTDTDTDAGVELLEVAQPVIATDSRDTPVTTTQEEIIPPAEELSPPAEIAQTPATADFGNAEWLLSQPSTNFTMQLLSSGSIDGVKDYIARQREPRKFSTYQAQVNGRTVYVVLFGMFTDRGAAESAATSLPAEVGNVSPWIRSLASVQSIIEESQSN